MSENLSMPLSVILFLLPGAILSVSMRERIRGATDFVVHTLSLCMVVILLATLLAEGLHWGFSPTSLAGSIALVTTAVFFALGLLAGKHLRPPNLFRLVQSVPKRNAFKGILVAFLLTSSVVAFLMSAQNLDSQIRRTQTTPDAAHLPLPFHLVGYSVSGPQTSGTYLNLFLLWRTAAPSNEQYAYVVVLSSSDGANYTYNFQPIVSQTDGDVIRDGPHSLQLQPGMAPLVAPGYKTYNFTLILKNTADSSTTTFANVGTIQVYAIQLFRNFVTTLILLMLILPFIIYLVYLNLPATDSVRKSTTAIALTAATLLLLSYPYFYAALVPPFRYLGIGTLGAVMATLVFIALYAENQFNYEVAVWHITFASLFFNLFILRSLQFPTGLGDVAFHLALVRNVLNGTMLSDPYFTSLPNWWPSGFHVLVAFFHLIGRVDLVTVETLASPFLNLLFVPSLFILGRQIRGEKAGLVMSFFGLFFNSFYGFCSFLFIPKALALTLLPATVAFYARRDVDPRYALFVGLLLAGQFFIYPYGAGVVGASILIVELLALATSRRRIHAFNLFMAVLPPIVVALVSFGPFFAALVGSGRQFRWFEFFTVDALDITGFVAPAYWPRLIIFVSALVGAFVCLKRPGWRVLSVLLFAALLIRPSYIVAIPWYGHPMGWQPGDTMGLEEFAVSILASVSVVVLLWHVWRSRFRQALLHFGVRSVPSLLLIMFILLTPAMNAYIQLALNGYQHQAYTGYPGFNYYQTLPAQSWILAHTNPSDVFLAPPADSMLLAAGTGRKIMLAMHDYTNSLVNWTERNNAANIVFQHVDPAGMMKVLRTYNVSYVVIRSFMAANFLDRTYASGEHALKFLLLYRDQYYAILRPVLLENRA